jgi:hypothetical protein
MGCTGQRKEKRFWGDGVRKMRDKKMRQRESSGRRGVCEGVGSISWKGVFSDEHTNVEDIFY